MPTKKRSIIRGILGGAELINLLAMAPVMVAVWVGANNLDFLNRERMEVQEEARTCGWQAATGACKLILGPTSTCAPSNVGSLPDQDLRSAAGGAFEII